MESLIIGTGFDIAMAQNGLLPPEAPPEEPEIEPENLPAEPTPIELAAVVDASALPFDPADPMWWFFGYA